MVSIASQRSALVTYPVCVVEVWWRCGLCAGGVVRMWCVCGGGFVGVWCVYGGGVLEVCMRWRCVGGVYAVEVVCVW